MDVAFYSKQDLTKHRMSEMRKPYYQDWVNIRKYHSGKTFLANPKIFRREVSLYFPNLFGRTLTTTDGMDTTPVIKGKISIINVFSSDWADKQVKTFTSADQNPALKELVESSGGRAQMVHINLEDKMERWIVLWATLFNLKRSVPANEQSRYFIIRHRLGDAFRRTIGWENKQVGYVYLVDEYCKIRWIGSGNATDEEKEALAKGLRKLIDEKPIGAKGTRAGPVVAPMRDQRAAEAAAL